MHYHILVPGFACPAEEASGPGGEFAATALATLIARGRRVSAPASGAERWLLGHFGVERQRDWPAAPLRLLGDGGSPSGDAWICADPVHLRFEQNRPVLADASRFRLEADEAAALAASANSHFGADFVLDARLPTRWYARLASAPDIETTPLGAARGRAIEARLPRGPDAMRWQALANELQMLLHDHPVNGAREARGELPVNSLWLWGAGTLPQLSARPCQFVAAADPLARGLALASGAQALELPAGAQAWISEGDRAGVALARLDALAAPSDYGEGQAWREALESLERGWFAPLLAALKAGRVGMLTLHLLGAGHTLAVEVTGADLRRFWRRRRPLAAWL